MYSYCNTLRFFSLKLSSSNTYINKALHILRKLLKVADNDAVRMSRGSVQCTRTNHTDCPITEFLCYYHNRAPALVKVAYQVNRNGQFFGIALSKTIGAIKT